MYRSHAKLAFRSSPPLVSAVIRAALAAAGAAADAAVYGAHFSVPTRIWRLATRALDDWLNCSIDCHIVALVPLRVCRMMVRLLIRLSFANGSVVWVVFCCSQSMHSMYYSHRLMLHGRLVFADAAVYFVWPLKTNWKNGLNNLWFIEYICDHLFLFRNVYGAGN